jgi:hypothetical protein
MMRISILALVATLVAGAPYDNDLRNGRFTHFVPPWYPKPPPIAHELAPDELTTDRVLLL